MFNYNKIISFIIISLVVVVLIVLFTGEVTAGENYAKPALFFQSDAGDLKVWWMDQEVREESEVFAAVEAGWQAKALADMDGDGHPDIYWLHEDGRLKVWLMEGLERIDTVYPLNPGTGEPQISPAWDMMAVADLNDSGSPDIIWQALSGPFEGDLAIWLMDGVEADRFGRLFNHPGVAKVSPLWEIGAVFDLMGDGQPEVIWQSVTGEAFDQLAYWQLDVEGDEFSRSASGRLVREGGRAQVRSEWRMKAAVDLMGDDQHEIIFQGIAGNFMNRVSYWVMEGPARVGGGRLDPDTVNPGWSIFGAAIAMDLPDTYAVTFSITDGEAPIEGAEISLNGLEAVTGENGLAEFEAVVAGEYDYTVSRDGYHPAVGTVEVVDEDVTVEVELDLITFEVIFDVTPADAIVTFNEEPYLEPVAVVPGTYDYRVEKDGYHPAVGTVEVVDEDVTVVVELDLITFKVTFADPDNGTLRAEVDGSAISSGDEAEAGKDVDFSAEPDAGYKVAAWIVNDVVVEGETGLTYTFENLDQAINVEVMLEEILDLSGFEIVDQGPQTAGVHIFLDISNATDANGHLLNGTYTIYLESDIEDLEARLHCPLPSGISRIIDDGTLRGYFTLYTVGEHTLTITIVGDDMNRSETITIDVVEPEGNTLYVGIIGQGSVELNNDPLPYLPWNGEFAAGEVVNLLAVPDEDWIFVEWKEHIGEAHLSSNPFFQVTLDENKRVIAVFEEDDEVVTDTYRIDFKVTDAFDGSNVEGADVEVFEDSARTVQLGTTQSTDADGEATLDLELEDGTYYYRVAADGYLTAEGQVVVAGENVTVAVSINADDIITAEDLGVEVVFLLLGVYNVTIPFDNAEEMLGATEESILILEVTGKDPLELFYVEDRDGFFKPATQGYSDAEIRGALVSVQ